MDILRKTVALCLIFSMLAITSACSSGTADSSSNSDSSSPDSSSGSDSVSVSEEISEQESISSDIMESHSESSEEIPEDNSEQSAEDTFFTTFVDSKTSSDCFTFEGKKGVWAHLINPFNQASLFNPTTADDFKADTESITICFNVSGVTSEISAFCGLCAYGSGDEDEELQVWDNDTYKSLAGEDFEYIIDKDGYYEMTIPVAKLASGLDFWEGLNYIYIIEVCFNGAQKTDAEGNYLEEFTDELCFEFLGIKAN